MVSRNQLLSKLVSPYTSSSATKSTMAPDTSRLLSNRMKQTPDPAKRVINSFSLRTKRVYIETMEASFLCSMSEPQFGRLMLNRLAREGTIKTDRMSVQLAVAKLHNS